MLPEKAIEEFKQLYQKRFGVVLSDDEASRQANPLVGLYQILYKETTEVRESSSALTESR